MAQGLREVMGKGEGEGEDRHTTLSLILTV